MVVRRMHLRRQRPFLPRQGGARLDLQQQRLPLREGPLVAARGRPGFGDLQVRQPALERRAVARRERLVGEVERLQMYERQERPQIARARAAQIERLERRERRKRYQRPRARARDVELAELGQARQGLQVRRPWLALETGLDREALELLERREDTEVPQPAHLEP